MRITSSSWHWRWASRNTRSRKEEENWKRPASKLPWKKADDFPTWMGSLRPGQTLTETWRAATNLSVRDWPSSPLQESIPSRGSRSTKLKVSIRSQKDRRTEAIPTIRGGIWLPFLTRTSSRRRRRETLGMLPTTNRMQVSVLDSRISATDLPRLPILEVGTSFGRIIIKVAWLVRDGRLSFEWTDVIKTVSIIYVVVVVIIIIILVLVKEVIILVICFWDRNCMYVYKCPIDDNMCVMNFKWKFTLKTDTNSVQRRRAKWSPTTALRKHSPQHKRQHRSFNLKWCSPPQTPSTRPWHKGHCIACRRFRRPRTERRGRSRPTFALSTPPTMGKFHSRLSPGCPSVDSRRIRSYEGGSLVCLRGSTSSRFVCFARYIFFLYNHR